MGTPSPASSAFPPLTAFEGRGVSVEFQFSKLPGSAPGTFEILATYKNGNPAPCLNFTFEIAVPKYIKLQMHSASSASIEAAGGAPTTQKIEIQNGEAPAKPTLMKIRVTFIMNGQQVQEAGQVANFPAGL
uniref:GAE domain-containing protein n=1 Tax=Chromera velia CCMP2878 TaxID=1169474 RepID=A0A0G4HRT6_9ALVE|eukprot:Cvel_30717.t1-p1 / transcript=Cvel_30717.t1 / gene=Cvel_30717 / organism=Chromera_velia_CCMP2878 / gene_product=AP-1 complex subunit gamma-1, putative / transcript_product=AP-1 complex subunit gamma-1, putative / location=Cvel_scaffold4433:3739-6064(+) / protein_length=130 / sequence_SO=supercontig / SO=protein_coding / is_pseudo=false